MTLYLKPKSIFEKFLVERKRDRISEIGRQKNEYVATGDEILGVISSLKTNEVEKFKSLKHDVDCVIIQKLGMVKAEIGDRLVKADRKYHVEAVENAAGLGQFYFYYCNSRFDLR